MTVKWQEGAVSGKNYCVECGGLLMQQDRRPRSLALRLKYPNSKLYVCRDCGCRNVVSRVPKNVTSRPPVDVGKAPVAPGPTPDERIQEIQQRIERNRRACLKLKELIKADERLLESLTHHADSRH